MGLVYLLRHGEPAVSQLCIGRTDAPLSPWGEKQAGDLGAYFAGREIGAVYASPLERARRTGEIVAATAATAAGVGEVMVDEGLAEIGMGEWDGLPFSEIMRRWPELYQQRGENPAAFVPPGGETPACAQDRAFSALRRIVGESRGDVVIAAHAGVNRLILCKCRGMPLDSWLQIPQPYGCINVLRAEGERIEALSWGLMPRAAPDDEECARLLSQRGTPPHVAAHCRAVADKAAEIARLAMERSAAAGGGLSLDLPLIRGAALLHDIAKGAERPAGAPHPALGAAWVEAAGYPRAAEIIACHCDIPEPAKPDEAAIVYLADKLIRGTEEVSLAERFAASLHKCHTDEARRAHSERQAQAERVWRLFFD